MSCTGFVGAPMGAVLQSITLTIGGAVTSGSTITLTNTSSSPQNASATTILDFDITNSGTVLPGFTLPSNTDFSDPSFPGGLNYIFQVHASSGTQSLGAGSGPGQCTPYPSCAMATVPVTGSASTAAMTDSNSSTFANYTSGFSFSAFTNTYLTSSLQGGNGSVTQSTQADAFATVTYNYIIPSSTPEPTTMVLLGGALIGLGVLRKRVKN